MYACSQAFKHAVANGAEQIALMIFDDLCLDNHDIDVNYGVILNDTFNPEKNLCIGKTLMNKLHFRVFNENGYLNNYGFGEFKATIGANIGGLVFNPQSQIHLESREHSYNAYAVRPYLRRDGNVVGNQPDTIITCMVLYRTFLYCFTYNKCYVYADNTGYLYKVLTLQSGVADKFMIRKANTDWAGIGCTMLGNNLKVWKGEIMKEYEFVPLGYFFAEKPNVGNIKELDFDCEDRMRLTEVDMPSDEELQRSGQFIYPLSFAGILNVICRYLHVLPPLTSFINSTATISERPEEFDVSTIRDVIGWIAEAAGANARFNREGNLELVWFDFSTSTRTINESGYTEYNPYWYKVNKINRLHNRTSADVAEKTIGSGTNGYLIQDNPLLRGVS